MFFSRLALAASVVLAAACPVRRAAAVSYIAEFAATWSAATHPGAYPAGADFSPLIGGIHSNAVSFWTPGGLASPGIEQMAEVGGVALLGGEVESAINAGSASAVINGSGVNSPGSTMVVLEASSAFPLVTLVTMVAPTPDWFVGVHGLDLRDGAGWKNQVSVPLYAYDAGTEQGVAFSLNNSATVPPAAIDLLAVPLAPSDPPLATLTFTRVSSGADFDGDADVDGLDLGRWRDGFGLSGSATNAQGDADMDEDVDGADFLVWQRQFTSGPAVVPAADAVPEPATLVTVFMGMLAIHCRLRRTVS